MSKIEIGAKVITKLYSCKGCGGLMILESFTDEATTLAMMAATPYCTPCEDRE